MDEFIDVLTPEGEFTGKKALKSEVHKNGWYHATAHIWFYTQNGDILLSQRSEKKRICPLLWDVSVAGHIDAGETITEGAIREIKEEIGLSISDEELNQIGVFKCFQTYASGVTDNEFHHTFIAELRVPIESLTVQEEEVKALKLVTVQEFEKLLDTIEIDNYHLIASNKSYYHIVLNHILEKTI